MPNRGRDAECSDVEWLTSGYDHPVTCVAASGAACARTTAGTFDCPPYAPDIDIGGGVGGNVGEVSGAGTRGISSVAE